MTGLTLTGNQLIIAIIILGLIVLLTIILLKLVLKFKLLKSTSTNYSIRSRVKAIGVDALQLRAPILKFGFLISLSFVLFAFSWTVRYTPTQDYHLEDIDEFSQEITPPRIKSLMTSRF